MPIIKDFLLDLVLLVIILDLDLLPVPTLMRLGDDVQKKKETPKEALPLRISRRLDQSANGLRVRAENKRLRSEEQEKQRELRESHARNKELEDEVARLKKGSCDGAQGVQQDTSLTTPKQTESMWNAFVSVDPMIQAVNEGSMISGGAPAQVVERPRTPSPEDCAIFLADEIDPGEIKTLLRHLNLSSVSIADLGVRHPKDPKEYRIDGIRTAIVSAKGDRITFLLDGLRNSKLNYQAELFCDKFNIHRPAGKDSPGLEPVSDFETVLQPFLKDPASIHTITGELNKEKDFTKQQLKCFMESFPEWNHKYRTSLEKKFMSRCTMDVLNVWASVEVGRVKGPNPAKGIEYLAKALRSTGRNTILETLKDLSSEGSNWAIPGERDSPEHISPNQRDQEFPQLL